jgi:hypothetical protein
MLGVTTADPETTMTTRISPAPAKVHDARRYWRTLLAVIAPIPWLCLAVSTVLNPTDGNDSDHTAWTKTADHLGQAEASTWFSVPFLACLVPAVIAVIIACRRTAPRLSAWIGTITIIGAAMGSTIVGPDAQLRDYVGAKAGLDETTVLKLDDKIASSPMYSVAIACFFLGTILIGRILLGILTWKAHVGPTWASIALIIAGPLDVFGGGAAHNTTGLISYLLTAIGFGAASLTLLRTRDNDFDLPPMSADQSAILDS